MTSQIQDEIERLTKERDVAVSRAERFKMELDCRERLHGIAVKSLADQRIELREQAEKLRAEVEYIRNKSTFFLAEAEKIRQENERLRSALGQARAYLGTVYPRSQSVGEVLNTIDSALNPLSEQEEP